MNFYDLDKKQQNHINGVLAKYMDAYIRNHLVWTPEQMYCDLIDELKESHNKGWYGAKYRINDEWVFVFKEGQLWMVTKEAEQFIMDRFNKKYKKNKKLARKKSPLIERARFGLKWDENNFFDINYGLKEKCSFEKMDIVENNSLVPWSIEHVEFELQQKYSTTLEKVIKNLSKSPIEIKFYEEWFEQYYHNKKNPALIPEFCGTRKMFYCYKNGDEYTLKSDLKYKPINVRFDFAVINFLKQKMLLIELDGHDYHKTKDQRINDSIKRTIATNDGWQMNVITGSQIYRDIDQVFDSMEDFFE